MMNTISLSSSVISSNLQEGRVEVARWMYQRKIELDKGLWECEGRIDEKKAQPFETTLEFNDYTGSWWGKIGEYLDG